VDQQDQVFWDELRELLAVPCALEAGPRACVAAAAVELLRESCAGFAKCPICSREWVWSRSASVVEARASSGGNHDQA
jgi:hypothetical protein